MKENETRKIKNFSVTKWLSYVFYSIAIGCGMLLMCIDIELTPLDNITKAYFIAIWIIATCAALGYVLDDTRRIMRVIRPALVVLGAWLYEMLPSKIHGRFKTCRSIKLRCNNSYRYTYYICKDLHDELYGFPGQH